MKSAFFNLGSCLVFGLLAGMLFNRPALGVLGGLMFHLIAGGIYSQNRTVTADG